MASASDHVRHMRGVVDLPPDLNRSTARPQRQLPACAARSISERRESTETAQASGPGLLEQERLEAGGYRLNVGICLVNREGLVFAAQRVDDRQGTWQMPQGGIDVGEDPAIAALRELQEETSVSSARIVATFDRSWLTYDFPTHVRCKLHGSWTKYRGQAQRWFLVQFDGEDSEIDLDTAHREFSSWRWAPLHELPPAVIEFKRGVYQQVAEEFAPIIERLVKHGGSHVSQNGRQR